MIRYKTDYSNHVHQLIVCPSKHFYITRKGLLKFQKKPFEVALGKEPKTQKIHVLHYLIRDHFSGNFYWELCQLDKPFPIWEFLFRAWSKTEDAFFYGLPALITISQKVLTFFPPLLDLIAGLGVDFVKVTSGFQGGGVRDIRTIEERLEFEQPFESVLQWIPKLNKRIISSGKVSKLETWRSGLPENFKTRLPVSKTDFERLCCIPLD